LLRSKLVKFIQHKDNGFTIFSPCKFKHALSVDTYMHIQRDGRTDGRTDGQTDRNTGRQAGRHLPSFSVSRRKEKASAEDNLLSASENLSSSVSRLNWIAISLSAISCLLCTAPVAIKLVQMHL
jgi:hypothetical protein